MNSVISSMLASLEKPAAWRWPPPPLFPGDRGDVEVCLGRPQADPVRRPVRGGRLADQRCELGALDRAQVVDDPLGVRLLRARVVEVLALEVGNDHAASLEDLCVLERARDELELGEGDVLVHALEDAVDVGPRLHELGGETKCLGRRVRVLEATRVGDDGDVERLGDRRREAEAELRKTSARISPVDEAWPTIRFTLPKRVLSWWWSMSTTSCAFSRSVVSGPSRRSFAQSSATTTCPEESGFGPRTIPAKSMNSYSFGIGTSPKRYMSASLPSSRRANVMARSEPRASPSGFSWVVTMKRSLLRRASATAARSASGVFVVVELIDEPGEARTPLHRRIVLKRQLWGSLQMELAVHATLEDAVRGLQAGEGGVALLRGPEHAHIDGGLAKVRARVSRRSPSRSRCAGP